MLKNLALTLQDFKCIFDHFSALYMKGLTVGLINVFLLDVQIQI